MATPAGFENKVAFIWKIAEKLRGHLKPHEYGNVMLPTLVLSRVDAVLEPTKPTVLAKAGVLSPVHGDFRRHRAAPGRRLAYSQMDCPSIQNIDVTDRLESTRDMLRHKLLDGVTVVRDYGTDLPRIEAHAGELNQVWTNLIDNAVDAFYTTQDVGKDTGLGLDTARRIIVERHGGTISIDSQPGETVLRVRVPIRAHVPR